jgi:uncharacterized LabA/DUF88 family protein
LKIVYGFVDVFYEEPLDYLPVGVSRFGILGLLAYVELFLFSGSLYLPTGSVFAVSNVTHEMTILSIGPLDPAVTIVARVLLWIFLIKITSITFVNHIAIITIKTLYGIYRPEHMFIRAQAQVKNMCFRTTDKNDRVMIFLDLANIEYGLGDYEGLENCLIDHEDLAEALIDGRKVAGAMAFDTKEYFKKNWSDAEYLSGLGYKIVSGHLEDGKQKEVDVSLAVEMLMHAVNDHYDVAILISGDRDFIPAISAVQSLGKKVEVAAFRESTSREVVNISDKFIDVAKMPIMEYHAPRCEQFLCSDGDFEESTGEFFDLSKAIGEAREYQGAE